VAYSTGISKSPARALWFNQRGQTVEAFDLETIESDVRLSPDGTRVASARLAPGDQADLWVRDLARGTQTRLTADPHDRSGPVWSPDGTLLAYVSRRQGAFEVQRVAATGSARPDVLFVSDVEAIVSDWSSDGRFLALSTFTPETRFDVSLLDVQQRQMRPVVTSDANEHQPRFSPDARWLAYASNRTGRVEVYVQRLPSGGPVPISVGGGFKPFWRGDGRGLFFVSPDYWVMTVDLEFGADAHAAVRATTPTRLFKLPENCGQRCVDVSVDRDGRFLVVYSNTSTELMRVVFNWASGRSAP
jgi:Tol biopolymer transport system component